LPSFMIRSMFSLLLGGISLHFPLYQRETG
jgi:hypothetical protein